MEITLETVPFRIFSCKKCATDTATLIEEFPSWNRDFSFCKAWWFPETDKVHCWLARDATEAEVGRYDGGGGKLLEETGVAGKDVSMNDTILRTIGHMREVVITVCWESLG